MCLTFGLCGGGGGNHTGYLQHLISRIHYSVKQQVEYKEVTTESQIPQNFWLKLPVPSRPQFRFLRNTQQDCYPY